jgi:hypothetical protein
MPYIDKIRAMTDETLFDRRSEVTAAELGCSVQTVHNAKAVLRKEGRRALPRKLRRDLGVDRIRAIYAHKVDVAFLETLGRGEE